MTTTIITFRNLAGNEFQVEGPINDHEIPEVIKQKILIPKYFNKFHDAMKDLFDTDEMEVLGEYEGVIHDNKQYMFKYSLFYDDAEAISQDIQIVSRETINDGEILTYVLNYRPVSRDKCKYKDPFAKKLYNIYCHVFDVDIFEDRVRICDNIIYRITDLEEEALEDQ